jgi:hypothetical protein
MVKGSDYLIARDYVIVPQSSVSSKQSGERLMPFKRCVHQSGTEFRERRRAGGRGRAHGSAAKRRGRLDLRKLRHTPFFERICSHELSFQSGHIHLDIVDFHSEGRVCRV